MATLRRNISQIGYPQAGDIDDCWLVSPLTALYNICPHLRLPNAKVFRAAAGVPDRSWASDGGTGRNIVTGLKTMYPRLQFEGIIFSWTSFKAKMTPGKVASIAVLSSKLPARLRYGFNGGHRICVEQIAPGKWIVLNPLAKSGTAPQSIGQATLREATSAFTGAGRVGAIIFTPSQVKEYFKLNVFMKVPGGGSFTLPTGKVIRLWQWGNGGWRVRTKIGPFSTAQKGTFDYRLSRTAGLAAPSSVIHVNAGTGVGYYISTVDAIETLDPVPVTYTQAQLDAAIAKSKAEVKEAVATALSRI